MELLCDRTSEIVDVTIYRKKFGSLMYLTNTRPNIFFAVNNLIQYIVESRCVHVVVAKHVVWYLNGTIEYGLKHVRNQRIFLKGYDDSY